MGYPYWRIPGLVAEVSGRIDHHGPDAFLLDLAGGALRLEQRLLTEETDVPAAITDQDQQRIDPRVAQPFGLDSFQGRHEAVGQRRGAADVAALQPPLGQVDA